MILVFFICALILLIIGFILSSISVDVKKVYISNCNNDNKLNYDYEIDIKLHLFNFIKVLSITIDKEKIAKLDLKNKIKKVNFKKIQKEVIPKEEAKEIIKKLNIELKKFDLKLQIGTIDVIFTTAIVTLLASGIGIGLANIIKEYKNERYNYEIYPIYQNKNLIKIELNCIIKVKMVHIISIIYLLLKKRRVEKNGRTSNRRAYDYSYE